MRRAPYAGINRIRFKGFALGISGQNDHPFGLAGKCSTGFAERRTKAILTLAFCAFASFAFNAALLDGRISDSEKRDMISDDVNNGQLKYGLAPVMAFSVRLRAARWFISFLLADIFASFLRSRDPAKRVESAAAYRICEFGR